jgi:hypothetical protein
VSECTDRREQGIYRSFGAERLRPKQGPRSGVGYNGVKHLFKNQIGSVTCVPHTSKSRVVWTATLGWSSSLTQCLDLFFLLLRPGLLIERCAPESAEQAAANALRLTSDIFLNFRPHCCEAMGTCVMCHPASDERVDCQEA